MGNHTGRELAQQGRRVRAGGGTGAAAELFVHAIRTVRTRHHLPGGQLRVIGRGRHRGIERTLPHVRARPAGRRLGGPIRDGLRHALSRSSQGDREPRSWRVPAASGRYRHDRAFAAVPLANGHGTGIFRRVRHTGDYGHEFAAVRGAGPAGGLVALRGASLPAGSGWPCWG